MADYVPPELGGLFLRAGRCALPARWSVQSAFPRLSMGTILPGQRFPDGLRRFPQGNIMLYLISVSCANAQEQEGRKS